jgi:hypothetical protein
MRDPREIALAMLKEWRELEAALDLLGMRDEIIHVAYEAGFSKMDLHKRTGLARSTIDRILMRPSPATRAR